MKRVINIIEIKARLKAVEVLIAVYLLLLAANKLIWRLQATLEYRQYEYRNSLTQIEI